MIIKQGWHIRTCTSKSLPVFHGGAPSFTPITLMSFFRNHSRRIKSSAELLYNSPTGTSPMREGGCVFTMKWAHLTEHLPRCSSASSPAGREHCYLEEPILDGAGKGAATQQFWSAPQPESAVDRDLPAGAEGSGRDLPPAQLSRTEGIPHIKRASRSPNWI